MTPSPDRENNREQNENPTEIQCRLVTRDLCDLHPHPSYVKHRLSVSADAVAALSAAGESVFRLRMNSRSSTSLHQQSITGYDL